MGKKKPSSTSTADVINSKGSSTQDAKRGVKGDPDPLRLAQYGSLIATHTLLLLFCMIFMPRSTALFMELPPQASSQDRPQAEWMAPVTVLPAWSVGWMCVGAAAVQVFWGRRLRTWVVHDEGNSAGAKLEEVRREMKDLWGAWGVTFLGAGFFHLLSVILGAPLMTQVPHTFLLSLLISILSVYIPARTLTLPPLFGSQSEPSAKDAALRAKWRRIFTDLSAKTRTERAILYPSLLAVFGAWCGAYPVALDWDRPWQAWPLTPAFGAILGHILGDWNSLFVSTVYYFGRTLEDPRLKTK